MEEIIQAHFLQVAITFILKKNPRRINKKDLVQNTPSSHIRACVLEGFRSF